MGFRAIYVALLLSSVPMAGCGTVANLANKDPEEGKAPFGGVKQDLSCIESASDGGFGVRKHGADGEQYPQWPIVFLCAADLPLSLVGDTVTWPYAAAYTYINQPVPTPTMRPVVGPAPVEVQSPFSPFAAPAPTQLPLPAPAPSQLPPVPQMPPPQLPPKILPTPAQLP